ncbi:hypothetical protein BO85DRAFT_488094 [Aspergillus piperis CBS 112811]|uniref:Uncharacterized protein n=1 Tax=Aspergillus piperis CBS 112811 TaxID=1448313 RepID=A0A8G1VL21_9EURO|nr:hypothetical protein BO85DRAFT_488094 [Aspergillus piperis CBS 112811]RAH57349.1 hypothetical protein BO85DRAFT_488094 [Aspergillus piperis CBS 112811]
MHFPAGLPVTIMTLALALPMVAASNVTDTSSSRRHLSSVIFQVLESIRLQDPDILPLATIYKATENSHPSSPAMMTAWRTITEVEAPAMLAIDTVQNSVYFISAISEGSRSRSILRGRIQVVDWLITELELFINRSRGDDGFAFSVEELYANYQTLMSLPAGQKKSKSRNIRGSGKGAFTEVGWKVFDTGTYGNGSTNPLGCSWDSTRPYDPDARANLVIDEELGFVVSSGMVQGKVYPYYGNISTFIPDSMHTQQDAQEVWINTVKGQRNVSLLSPTEATGENMEVVQYYNDELQALQLNVFLTGPNMTSAWL